jgi:hypothetical protein
MERRDTIAFRVFLPDLDNMTALGRSFAVDEGGMPIARCEITANGELLNANCVSTDPINWDDLVTSTMADGDFHLAICCCNWEPCRPETPYQIHHADGFVHCFIEWSKHWQGNRQYCLPVEHYLQATRGAFSAAEKVLNTRAPIAEDFDGGDVQSEDLITNIGHGFFTLREFLACKARFFDYLERRKTTPTTAC